MRRAVRLFLALVTVAAVTVLFVLPGRTYLEQNRSLAATRHRIQVLDKENAALANQAAALQSDARVEQLARQRYGLVKPGEEAYVVLPPSSPGSTTTTTVPSGR